MSDGAARAVVFSDLDGTFLDQHTYRPGPAADALAELSSAGALVVFCSAKTRTEMQHLHGELGLDAPFIVENGAAVADARRVVASFGVPYTEVLADLSAAVAEAEATIRSYGDMTPAEIGALTGLSLEEAGRAQTREYSVTFLIEGETPAVRSRLSEALASRGLQMVQGALFYSAQGPHDKGTAVRYLIDILHPRRTYAIGDFDNDLPMLRAVGTPMLVQRPGGAHADVDVHGLVRLEGVGPEGWVLGAKRIIADLSG